MSDTGHVPVPRPFAFLNRGGPAASDLPPLSEPVIRQATVADYRYWYPDKPVPTFEGLVGEVDGRPVAIGGFCHYAGYIVGFVDLKDEAAPYFMQFYSAVRTYVEKAQARGHRRIYALRDPDIKSADRFIRHFGFTPLDGDPTVYEWKK